jgi:hypothetical protein
VVALSGIISLNNRILRFTLITFKYEILRKEEFVFELSDDHNVKL